MYFIVFKHLESINETSLLQKNLYICQILKCPFLTTVQCYKQTKQNVLEREKGKGPENQGHRYEPWDNKLVLFPNLFTV